MRIGLLALQGDYEAHGRMLDRLGVAHVLVRRADELDSVDGLIIPGGESTTFLTFLEEGDFLQRLRALPGAGKPVFGTCAGTILLAKEVANPPQQSLGLMDITVERNGFGRQLSSDVLQGSCTLVDSPMEMVFIRAPRIRRVGKDVKVLAELEGEPVCVQQGLCLAATFHPELSDETVLHRHFLSLIPNAKELPALEEAQRV